MCWSVPVTLGFLLAHLTAAQLVARLNTRYRSEFLIFIYFYAVMEFLQLSQWIIGSVNTCNITNKALTLIAYLLIWLQPIMFSYIGLRQCRERKAYYTYALYLSLLALAVVTVNIFMSYYTNKHVIVLNTPNNFGNETCTYIGKYGHLSWKLPIYTLDIHPSYFVYVAVILLCILKYPVGMQLTMGIGWFATLLVSIYFVGGSDEIPSFWCLLSVFADIPIVIYSYLRSQ